MRGARTRAPPQLLGPLLQGTFHRRIALEVQILGLEVHTCRVLLRARGKVRYALVLFYIPTSTFDPVPELLV